MDQLTNHLISPYETCPNTLHRAQDPRVLNNKLKFISIYIKHTRATSLTNHGDQGKPERKQYIYWNIILELNQISSSSCIYNVE